MIETWLSQRLRQIGLFLMRFGYECADDINVDKLLKVMTAEKIALNDELGCEIHYNM